MWRHTYLEVCPSSGHDVGSLKVLTGQPRPSWLGARLRVNNRVWEEGSLKAHHNGGNEQAQPLPAAWQKQGLWEQAGAL